MVNPGCLENYKTDVSYFCDAQLQTSKTDIRSFLGIENVYRCIIDDRNGLEHHFKIF